jgi:ATP-dependent Lon protease
MEDKVDIYRSTKPVKDVDYVETDSTFTILNVPILAEMVQYYTGYGYALKANDEIQKVDVTNVPLTMVDEEPTHPEHLAELKSEEKARVTVGYMSEPSRPKEDRSATKRYADFILYKTPKGRVVIDTYLGGKLIDTSIGFKSREDYTPGMWNGQKYDFVQRDIVLDHNAILIDRAGNIGVGRMPTPIGGIGADSNPIAAKQTAARQAAARQVGEQAMEANDEMQALKDEVASLKEKLAVAVQADAQEKLAELAKTVDEQKKTIDTVSADLVAKTADLQTALDALKVYQDKEIAVYAAKRDALSEAYPAFASLFAKADMAEIDTHYTALQEKQKSPTIGTDMMRSGAASTALKETERIAKYAGKKE